MSDLKLLSKPSEAPETSKYQKALENMKIDANLSYHIHAFYNRHLTNFILLNEEHDFLSEYEAQLLMYLGDTLNQGILEDISEYEVGLSNSRV